MSCDLESGPVREGDKPPRSGRRGGEVWERGERKDGRIIIIICVPNVV